MNHIALILGLVCLATLSALLMACLAYYWED